jgi:hypothetical protein
MIVAQMKRESMSFCLGNDFHTRVNGEEKADSASP